MLRDAILLERRNGSGLSCDSSRCGQRGSRPWGASWSAHRLNERGLIRTRPTLQNSIEKTTKVRCYGPPIQLFGLRERLNQSTPANRRELYGILGDEVIRRRGLPAL